jgi:hypothetical protein
MMTSVVDVMSDAIGALDYATDALEAPAGSQMRETVRDLKDARRTVAELLSYTERLLGFAYHYGDMTALRAGGGLMDGAQAAINKAKGEA